VAQRLTESWNDSPDWRGLEHGPTSIGGTTYSYDARGRLSDIMVDTEDMVLEAKRGPKGWKITAIDVATGAAKIIPRNFTRRQAESALQAATGVTLAPHRPDQSKYGKLDWDYDAKGRLTMLATEDMSVLAMRLGDAKPDVASRWETVTPAREVSDRPIKDAIHTVLRGARIERSSNPR